MKKASSTPGASCRQHGIVATFLRRSRVYRPLLSHAARLLLRRRRTYGFPQSTVLIWDIAPWRWEAQQGDGVDGRAHLTRGHGVESCGLDWVGWMVDGGWWMVQPGGLGGMMADH